MKLNNKIQQALKTFIVIITLSVLKIDSAFAATEWGAPSKPGGVPSDLREAVMNITNWLLGFVGMIAVLAIVWGGINYIGSVGDEDKAKTAKKTITYGIMGVVIAGFAYAIVKVIVSTILT